MLVISLKDGERFYVGETRVRVLIEEYYVDGKLERVVEFEVVENNTT